LDRELTGLEANLVQLRRRYAEVQRTEDLGSLEILALRGELKAREDELAYVGNLLDEYARNYESKINVSELQYLGQPMEAAKQATGNNALSTQEKFTRQLAFVYLSVQRLSDAIGGMRFHGEGVNTEGDLVKGEFALIGPVALFSAGGGVSGVVIPQKDSTKPPLIRPLEGDLQNGIANLVASGEGTMPLDPSRGAALKALVQKTNLFHIFKKGGPIMWPLLIASIVSLGTVVERMFFLLVEKMRRSHKALNAFLSAVAEGAPERAIHNSGKSKFFVVRALRYALMHKEESLSSALLYAQARELKRFERGIPVLDTVITLAPLLGLLGTVTGMMGAFSLIGGEVSASGAITGGIAEALIATAFGLGIAITSLIPFNFLNARTEEARHEIEAASTQLELLVVRPAGDLSAAARPDAAPAVQGKA
jgi:biopolymer transport protein ExbB